MKICWSSKKGVGCCVIFSVLAGVCYAQVDSENNKAQLSFWQVVKRGFAESAADAMARKLADLACCELGGKHHVELYDRIKNVAAVANVVTPRVFVVEADSPAARYLRSEQLPTSLNAFVMAGARGKPAVVVIAKDLIDLLTADEMEGIIAHEIAHIKHDHVRRAGVKVLPMALGSALVIGLWDVYAPAIFKKIPGKTGDWCVRHTDLLGNVVSVTTALALISGVNTITRGHEKEADLTAVALTRKKDLATALEKMEQAVCGRCSTASKIDGWFYRIMPFLRTHPSVDTRVGYINAAKIDEACAALAVKAGA